MLSVTKLELELISDADCYLVFQKNIRGGVSYFSKRCSKAKNKYLRLYNPIQVSKHIKYFATKNLYDYTMFKLLPTSEFKRIDLKEFDYNKYISNSSNGCVLEVDLEYPKELCELHNDYPLAPDKKETTRKTLSSSQFKIDDLLIFLLLQSKNCCLTFWIKKVYSIMRTYKFT